VLRDVSFDVRPGESVGLVGQNGAGKSTLLKLLVRVMYPYAGSVEVAGRVGALIEVRSGIHPDLTGRENAFLTGSLLGLKRREVTRRFDDIVAFAQLESAIDRQVKFYSTGMQMRLGFAVAAFLEPDVLVVDEVLAVGDAAFQQRCLDRMREVLAQGTTLVLVSHDLPSVEAMCGRSLWMRDGVIAQDGPTREVLAGYRGYIEEYAEAAFEEVGEVRLGGVEARRPDGGIATTHAPLRVSMTVRGPESGSGRIYVGISEGPATPTLLVSTRMRLSAGETAVGCTIDGLPLPRGRYALWVGLIDDGGRDLVPWHPSGSFDVAGPDLDPAPPAIVRLSPVHARAEWTVDRP